MRLALVLSMLALCGCPPIHRGVANIVPGVPPVSDCTPHASRCAGAVVEACATLDGVTRWLPVSVEPCLHGCILTAPAAARCALAGEVAP